MMENSWEEWRRRHQGELERALQRAVELLSDLPEVRKVILFGSYARGRRDLFTDLDLVVIIDSDEDFLARLARLYSRLGGRLGVDLDLLAYTPREAEQLSQRGFLRRVLKEGQALYERG